MLTFLRGTYQHPTHLFVCEAQETEQDVFPVPRTMESIDIQYTVE